MTNEREWSDRACLRLAGSVLAAMLLLAGVAGAVYRPVTRDYQEVGMAAADPSPAGQQRTRDLARAFLQRNGGLPLAPQVARWYVRALRATNAEAELAAEIPRLAARYPDAELLTP